MLQPALQPTRYVLDAPVVVRRSSIATAKGAPLAKPQPAASGDASSQAMAWPPSQAPLFLFAALLLLSCAWLGYAWRQSQQRASLAEANHGHLLAAVSELLALHQQKLTELRATETSREQLLTLLDRAAQQQSDLATELRVWQNRQQATSLAMQQQADQWQSYGTHLQQRLSLTASELTSREADLLQQQRVSEEKEATIETLASSKAAIASEADRLNDQVNRLNRDIHGLQSNVSRLESCVSSLESRKRSLESENSSLSSTISSLRSEISCLQSRLSSAEARCRDGHR